MNELWAADEVWEVDRVWPVNETNITLEDYLLERRGPKHVPLVVVVPITIIYSTIFISGLIGNIATCLVIITNTSLHTATNYYLFSLSVSDITLLLLGLPNDLAVFWQQYPWKLGEFICKFRALISEMTSYTSVLTIVAFSMERYLAICHPLLSYTMAGLRRAVRIVAMLWLLSFLGALPFFWFTKVNYITYPPNSEQIVEESAFCGMLEENIPKYIPISELSFCIFFLIPLAVILLLYTLIGVQIRSKTLGKSVKGSIHGATKKFKSKKSIIRMLVAVVVTFFFCWAPYHAQRLFYVYGRGSKYYFDINEYLYYVAGCFYYLSTTANPILYNLMSVKYRDGFRHTFCCKGQLDQRYSSVSVRDNSGEVRRQRLLSTLPTNHDPVTANKQMSLPWTNQDKMQNFVVTITPNESRTTVVTETKRWPSTRLQVTIDHPNPASSESSPATSPRSIQVQMETACL